MVATFTLCASRNMLSSVCLLPMPLAFHLSMLNVFSMSKIDTVRYYHVGRRVGGMEGGCGGVLQVVQIQLLALR